MRQPFLRWNDDLLPAVLTDVTRIEYVAVLGSFAFVVVESILRVLTLALRKSTLMPSPKTELSEHGLGNWHAHQAQNF